MGARFDSARALDALTNFQLATVDHVMEQLFAPDSSRRFLVADETGLGKSLVARGVIAKTIERLQDDENISRIDIVYICSNSDIADQNLRRLNVTGEEHLPFASRLTLLAKESHRLKGQDALVGKPVNLVAFTPRTSFDRGRNTGRAEERALLFILLRDICKLDAKDQRRAKVLLHQRKSRGLFDGTIASLERHIDRHGGLDQDIRQSFAKEIEKNRIRYKFERALERIGQRQSVPEECNDTEIVRELLRTLAGASVDCLEPDLVILDEFQRFRHLLDKEEGGDAAELAHDLFDYNNARVLLLSATPYKAFTYAEERLANEDHHSDFFKTLEFLTGQDAGEVEEIKKGVAGLRAAVARGDISRSLVEPIQERLLRYMCRTERPQAGDEDMLTERMRQADQLEPSDLIEFAALSKLAKEIGAELRIEYWKSAPFFVNFSDGYQFGERLREHSRLERHRAKLERHLAAARLLDRSAVLSRREFDAGNAKMRLLVDETVGRGWWKLLWMPPSLPYFEPRHPFPESGTDVTKLLVFSSWNATPTAVASLLSYHADLRVTQSTGGRRQRGRGRLEFRIERDPSGRKRPASMTTLALFWPNPALAEIADPLRLASNRMTNATATERTRSERFAGPLDVDQTEAELADELSPLIGGDGHSQGTEAEAWYWIAAFQLQGAVPPEIVDKPDRSSEALAGRLPETLEDSNEQELDSSTDLRSLVEHVTALGTDPEKPTNRPTDLRSTIAKLGLHGPGNIAWRSLKRQLGPGHQVSEEAHWHAAATISGGLRALFNRPDAASLLHRLYGEREIYWRAVLAYCAAGNLQAVLDEYLHHLKHDKFPDPLTDETILQLAGFVRQALTIRPAAYTAFDPLNPHDEIRFQARFALRYGNRRQVEDGDSLRQPHVRNAFNSPFWPFVLTTTSIGQEGVDFHWWCHAVVHWNTTANPVDFEQREGRVHRYGGHAIRKNVAAAHRTEMLGASASDDPWRIGYQAAVAAAAAAGQSHSSGDMTPHWVYPGPAKIQRIVMPYPLSVDIDRLRRVKQDVALYRLAFGQPRQEDYIELLRRQGVDADPERIRQLQLDLRPLRGLPRGG